MVCLVCMVWVFLLCVTYHATRTPSLPVAVHERGLLVSLRAIRDFFPANEDGVHWVSGWGLNNLNVSFYLNHSDTPNVEPHGADGPYVGFRTNRDIRAGEELCYCYSDAKISSTILS